MRVPVDSMSHLDVTFRRERMTYSHPLPSGEIVTKPKKHPDTFVEVVLRTTSTNEVARWSASVGCAPTDQFTKEGGRLAALRKVRAAMPPALYATLMRAYMHRARPQDLNSLRRQYTALMHQIAAAEARQRESVERSLRDLSTDSLGG